MICRRAAGTIRQNLLVTAVYNAVGVTLATPAPGRRERVGILAYELAHILRRGHRMVWQEVLLTPMGCGSLPPVIGF
jgi:cation transport ATPase